jgi:hypothetical protein
VACSLVTRRIAAFAGLGTVRTAWKEMAIRCSCV